MDILKKLVSYVEEKIEGTDFFIVATEKNKDNSKFRILVDGDKGFGIHDCSVISRHVSEKVDEELSEEKFTFEISSPGADKPLTMFRQYIKNIGRTLQIQLQDGKEYTGKLLSAEDDKILIETEPKGKGKKAVTEQIPLRMDQIKQTKIKISFK